MTENECIEILQYLLGYENAVDKGEIDTPNNINSQEKEALRMILEEVQAYREIGTVEDLKTMKENGAFSGVELASIACMQMKLKDYQSIGTVEDIQLIFSLCKDLERIVKKYEAIGTIDEFKALKEKSVSKKVVAISLTHEGRVGNCPNCNNFVAENYDKKCPKCRIKLDWQ